MIFLTVGLKNFNPTETQKVNKEEKRELHFLNAVPHHSVLKASKCTINRYRYMANPKGKFPSLMRYNQGYHTSCAPTGG